MAVLSFLPEVRDVLRALGDRDRAVVAENIESIAKDPRAVGHPSGLRSARSLAWQHVCPHSFVVVFRWAGGDPGVPDDAIVVEGIVPRF
ncbi:MAG TPA: hypothetical protein VLT47_09550 [Anaeromyxobacteraceae bacterium]|nr:hypothetical protein [Anaeromyxobacteraceae bacterium]